MPAESFTKALSFTRLENKVALSNQQKTSGQNGEMERMWFNFHNQYPPISNRLSALVLLTMCQALSFRDLLEQLVEGSNLLQVILEGKDL